MKRINHIIGLMAMAAMVVVFACSKEETETSNKNQITKNQNEAIHAFNRIIDFKEKISFYKSNPEYKSGELINIDDVLWDFNALLNFDFSSVNDPYNGFYNEAEFPVITIDQNNMVNMDEAADVYLLLETEIQNALNAAPFSNKAVQFTFVKVENIEGESLTLKSTTSVGNKGTDGTLPFDSDDDWMYGDDLGKCDSTFYGQTDSGDEIEDMLESRRHIHISDPPGTFYVNPIEIFLDKEDIDSNPLLDMTNGQGYDNTKDYRIFYAHESNCPTGTNLSEFECIMDYDMNYYLFQMETLVYNIIPGNPTYWPTAHNKTFIRFEDIYGTIRTEGTNEQFLIHEPTIVFAKKFVIEE